MQTKTEQKKGKRLEVHSRDELRGVNSNNLTDINLEVRNEINHQNKSFK